MKKCRSGSARAALTAFTSLVALAGCGGSQAWVEVAPAAREAAANQYRSSLRAAVGGTTPELDAAVQTMAVTEPAQESSGGFDFDFGGDSGPPAPSPWDPPSGTGSMSAADQLRSEVQVARSVAGLDEARPRYAQATPQPADGRPETATDATSRQLLLYEAHLGLAVHHVVEVQDRIEAAAREEGGFLRSRTDDSIIVRVPADAFQRFLESLRELGEVVSRRVQVQDVTEEFHDVQQRIRTLEAMRAQVERLLQDADDVESALAVQQHLERITVDLEQLQGRLRFLSNRVAFSTVTIHFAERTATSAPTFQLPFGWLHSLGIDTLLSL